jgi:site-specific DNA-methyltransferase (adenine-specific)
MTSLADRKSLLEKIPPFPIRPAVGYGLIMTDPPWAYRDKANAGDRGAVHKYPVLSLNEIKALRPEVQKSASDNCALALWATAPMMGEARDVLSAWGFKYSTIAITWIKSTKTAERLQKVSKTLGVTFEALVAALNAEGLTVMRPKRGMGNWTRSNAEFLLLGTQGKVTRVSKSVGSVIVSEPREHSRKPDEARAMLEELFGDIPRLEMFSRASAPGWASWGLEAGIFDEGEEEGEEENRMDDSDTAAGYEGQGSN